MGGRGEESGEKGPRRGELPRLAFLSSVIDNELLEVRERVVATLGQAPFLLPWAFEMTPASSEALGDDYLRKVREATFVFWFAGARTTKPVEMEIAEALAAKRRLLVFRLPAERRDSQTEDLLEKAKPHSRYRSLADLDLLEAEVEAAVADEIARALDGEPSRSRTERLDLVGRESLARCIQKWQAAGVGLELARRLASDIRVGVAPPFLLPSAESPLVVLVAEAGCGKSLASERVLQSAIAAQLEDATRPVPSFVTAKEALGNLRSTVTAACEGLGDPRRLGAVVVIDGADEAADGAALLLGEARELGHSWPETRILLSTRPLSQFDRIPEARTLPRLDDEGARAIVALAAGRPISYGEQAGWSEPAKDAAAVPLFALLIGGHIAETGEVGEATRTSLLAELAERGLEGTDPAARPALRRLAVASIARGGGRVPRSELGGLETLKELEVSRLIAGAAGEVWFPLALMAQWFAAESLAEGEPTGEELAAVPADLELWRYPLAILAATGSHRQALAVLGPLASRHPGFLSQIVEESIVRWPGGGGLSPPRQEAGLRIREAMGSWLDCLEPLGSILRPRLVADGKPLPAVGVTVDGERLLVGWYAGDEETDAVVELPAGVAFGGASDAEAAAWPTLRGARPPSQASWALRWTFDELSGRLQRILNDRALPLEGTGLEAPRLWRAARAVLGLPETHRLPIDIRPLRERSAALAVSVGERPWRTSEHPVDLDKLIARLDELEAAGIAGLSPPPLEVEPSGRLLIPPDAQEEIALAHVNAVYAAALDAYWELTGSLFRPLQPFMHTAVLLPAVLKGDIYESGDRETGRFSRYVQWWLDPLPPGRASAVEIVRSRADESRREYVDRWQSEADRAIVTARRYRPEQARWINIIHRSHELAVHGPLAVEEIIYDWLWSDLKRIRWVSGQITESHYKTVP